MFIFIELFRNGENIVIVFLVDFRLGGNIRGSEIRIINMNFVIIVNRVDDLRRFQVSNFLDELNMEFRNFIWVDGGQIDLNDILYRFFLLIFSLNIVLSILSERMLFLFNFIFGEIVDLRVGFRIMIIEICSNMNIGSDFLNF